VLYGGGTSAVFDQWWQYALEHYIPLPPVGHPPWVVMYRDPIIDYSHHGGPPVAIALALYLSAQKPDVARRLFDWVASAYHWNDGEPIPSLRDPRTHALGLVLARELGAVHAERHLRAFAEERFEPTWDRGRGEFTWGFGLGEPVPRGQLNATIMMAEVLTEGAWWSLFNQPNLRKFAEPTVCGVDYPMLGIAQAWYDPEERCLAVTTYAADPRREGAATQFRVSGLGSLHGLQLTVDGEPFHEWKPVAAGTIEIRTSVTVHQFLIGRGGRQQEVAHGPVGRRTKET